MKKISLLILLLLLLTACGTPNEDDVYADVVSILEVDLLEEGIAYSSLSSQGMTEFKDLENGLYEVNGKIQTSSGGMYPYSMKIKYDGKEWEEYEWIIE